MRILHIISSLQRGGAEMALANLLMQLQTHASHAVIFFHDGPVRNMIEDLGIPCIQIRTWGSYANPLFFLKLINKVKFFTPDCIHTDLWAANLLGRLCARLLRIPCVSVVHAMTEHEGRTRTIIDRIVPCTPTTYVAVSQAVQQSLATHKRLHAAPCVIIKNGINAAALQKNSVAVRIDKQSDTFLIGAVGRLITEKNYAVLLHSFAQLHKVHEHIELMIIGSGPEEIPLKKLAEQLQISHKINWLGNRLAHPYYQFFDCYVQPSKTEGLSIALLEALSCSLPVIVTGKQKSHEVIQDGLHGIVIEPNDIDALTAALCTYIEQPELRKQYGAAGYQTATERFSMQATAQEYMRLFKQIRAQR